MHQRLILSWSLSLLLALTPVRGFGQDMGSGSLPEMGDSSEQVLSPALEKSLGRAFLQNLRRSGSLIEDPEIETYIEALGQRVLSSFDTAGRDFKFLVVRSSAINAFAAPGGIVGINSGLIQLTESESELAAVLAHEIAHVTQRHIARAYEAASRMSLPVAAAMMAAVILGGGNSQISEAAITTAVAGSRQMQINFTRSNEREADSIGMQYLAGAGFDPHSMPSFFEKLQKSVANYGGEVMDFLSTHPVNTARIADSRNRAIEHQYQPSESAIDYYLIKSRLLVLASNDLSATVNRLQIQIENQRYSNAQASRYALALAQTKNGASKAAQKLLQELLKKDSEQPAYLLAIADLAMRDGDTKAAVSYLDSGLALYPGHLALELAYADALLRLDQPAKARLKLLTLNRKYPENTDVIQELSRATTLAGFSSEGRYYLARYYLMTGNAAAAREQVQLALKDKSTSAYQRERLKDLDAQLTAATKKP